MPYTTLTLAQFAVELASLMDDVGNVYWPIQQVQYAVWEGLRVWGSVSGFWKARGAFQTTIQAPVPYYDLSQVIPTVRTRTYPLWRLVQDIQYALNEPPSPDGTISGTQMSHQLSIDDILTAISVSRNRFVWDAAIPLAIHTNFAPAGPGQDLVTYPDRTMMIHRLSWQDTFSGVWNRLRRQDDWAIDRSVFHWPLLPGTPSVYSESSLTPLTLQLVPRPMNVGSLEAITIDSLVLDTTNPNATLGIPDEWIYAVKYAALSYILSGEGQIKDALRAQYAEQRYNQAVEFAKQYPYVLRVTASGIPLNLDTIESLDSAQPYWRAWTGYPLVAATFYDFMAFTPGMQADRYGITADCVTPAPLPGLTDYIQLGQENIDHLLEYVNHVLNFKCGGKEFTDTMISYDTYMKALDSRKAIENARIWYMEPMFGWHARETASNPNRVEAPRV